MSVMKTLTINGSTFTVAPVVPSSSVTTLASAWVGSEYKYSQVVTIPGVTTHTKVDIQATSDQLVDFHPKVLGFVAENDGGTVTIFAIGDKPRNDHTFQVTLTEVQAAGNIRGNFVSTTTPRADWAQTDPTKADYIKNKPKYTAQDVGADPAGTASSIMQGHNESRNAHEDIRLDIRNLRDQVDQMPSGGGGVALTPQMFGAVGDGAADDTAAIQTMFDAADDGGLIYFPAGTYVVRHGEAKTDEDYVAVTVRGRHGLRVVLDNGATILHKATTVHRYTMLRFEDCDGVEIVGGVIEGDRQSHQAVTSGYGSKGIHIVDCANIYIHDMEVRQIFGDCIGITGATKQCENVLIENCTLHDSYRNGVVIGGVRHGTVRNCRIYGIVGADPQAGIDLEAERGVANENILIEGCRIHGCGKNTIAFSANGSGTKVRDCILDGNTACVNTHTGIEIAGTVITGTANLRNDVVLRGCTVTAVSCYDDADHPNVSLTAYNTVFGGVANIPTIQVNGVSGNAELRFLGCEMNHPESSGYALVYSYNNSGDVDVAMDGCVVNLRNGTALHRQMAHGEYRTFAMNGCTIAVKSATMDYSFIRMDAAQVRICNCIIDLSCVESYPPTEIARFKAKNSTVEFHSNVILAAVAISNALWLEGFTGTARITNNTAPVCGAMVKVTGSSGTVVEKGNITANSTEGGADTQELVQLVLEALPKYTGEVEDA